jgi:putative transposase
MARALRLEYAGAVYHVTSRGNEGKRLFRDRRDRERFQEVLTEAVRRYRWIVSAATLMGNHYHLVVETPEPNLSAGMRYLNGTYAQWFNRRHKRSGHLFGERYGATLVEKNEYLRNVARYVVLNPVRAKMVKHPAGYEWSSYRASAGLSDPPGWLSIDALRPWFGDEGNWRENYVSFVESKVDEEDRLWSGLRRGHFLGSEKWLDEVRQEIETRMRCDDHPERQRYAGRPAMYRIVEVVAETFGMTARELRKQRGGVARQIAAWVGRYEGIHRLRKIAATLLLRSSGHVTELIRKAEASITADVELQIKLRAIYAALA